MAEFETPYFLRNRGTDANFELMKSILPGDIDLSEGSHGWNMTRPTALAMAELCEMILPEIVRLIIPEWSYGTILDGHAKGRDMVRRSATAASGTITITGKAGTSIPAGTLFSTAAVNDEPSVDYATTKSAKIQSNGSVTIPIQCTDTGIIGNTAANTIVLISGKNSGITSVTNAEAVMGGAEEESDESLRKRIAEFDQGQGKSYTGCPADYKMWATSVAGVGEATIISAQDNSGLVRIILTDTNGAPATTNLCDSVYNYIMKPDDPVNRRAPVGAMLVVSPPDTITIGVRATVKLADNATIESVTAAYKEKLAEYLPVAFAEGEVKYTRVAAALASVDGADDYTDLQICVKTDDTLRYGTDNIIVSASQLPLISDDDLILTAGTF